MKHSKVVERLLAAIRQTGLVSSCQLMGDRARPAVEALETRQLLSAAPVYLSDLTAVSATNGWGPVERDKSNGEKLAGDGRTLTLNGATYAKGLGAHANSTVVYTLGGQYTSFQAAVGIDDEVGTRGSAAFQVYLDGAKVFDSGIMTGVSATRAVSLDVTGKGQLKLVVNDAGDGFNYDHADWADARLVPGTTTSTTPTPPPTPPADPTPPSGSAVPLSSLTPTSSRSGYGPVEINSSNGESGGGDGRALTLNGVRYSQGLGVHAGSELVYTLGGQYANFQTSVGIDDEVGTRGSTAFQVYLDGAKVFDSGIMTGASPTRAVSLDVTGKGQLKLVVNDAGDGFNYDHADWADARLVPGTTTSTTPTPPPTAPVPPPTEPTPPPATGSYVVNVPPGALPSATKANTTYVLKAGANYTSGGSGITGQNVSFVSDTPGQYAIVTATGGVAFSFQAGSFVLSGVDIRNAIMPVQANVDTQNLVVRDVVAVGKPDPGAGQCAFSYTSLAQAVTLEDVRFVAPTGGWFVRSYSPTTIIRDSTAVSLASANSLIRVHTGTQDVNLTLENNTMAYLSGGYPDPATAVGNVDGYIAQALATGVPGGGLSVLSLSDGDGSGHSLGGGQISGVVRNNTFVGNVSLGTGIKALEFTGNDVDVRGMPISISGNGSGLNIHDNLLRDPGDPQWGFLAAAIKVESAGTAPGQSVNNWYVNPVATSKQWGPGVTLIGADQVASKGTFGARS